MPTYREPPARGSEASPSCTASAQRSTTTCTCTHACPTASSCRLPPKQRVTPRRRSRRPGQSLPFIWPRSGSGSFSIRKTCLTPSGQLGKRQLGKRQLGKRQKAKGKRQKAKGKRQKGQSPFADTNGASPCRCRRRGSTGIATTGCLRRITSRGGPSRHWQSATSASSGRPRTAGMGTTVAPRGAAVTRSRIKSPARTTRHGLPGRN